MTEIKPGWYPVGRPILVVKDDGNWAVRWRCYELHCDIDIPLIDHPKPEEGSKEASDGEETDGLGR